MIQWTQLDLIDIYRTYHLKAMIFTFFSSAQGNFSRIDHTLCHKSSLDKLQKKKKTEIISNIFSDHNEVRLDVNYMKKLLKYKHMEAKQHFQITKKSQKKLKKKSKYA